MRKTIHNSILVDGFVLLVLGASRLIAPFNDATTMMLHTHTHINTNTNNIDKPQWLHKYEIEREIYICWGVVIHQPPHIHYSRDHQTLTIALERVNIFKMLPINVGFLIYIATKSVAIQMFGVCILSKSFESGGCARTLVCAYRFVHTYVFKIKDSFFLLEKPIYILYRF